MPMRSPVELCADIMAFIKKHGETRPPQIMAALNAKQDTVDFHVRTLVSRGLIVKVKKRDPVLRRDVWHLAWNDDRAKQEQAPANGP